MVMVDLIEVTEVAAIEDRQAERLCLVGMMP